MNSAPQAPRSLFLFYKIYSCLRLRFVIRRPESCCLTRGKFFPIVLALLFEQKYFLIRSFVFLDTRDEIRIRETFRALIFFCRSNSIPLPTTSRYWMNLIDVSLTPVPFAQFAAYLASLSGKDLLAVALPTDRTDQTVYVAAADLRRYAHREGVSLSVSRMPAFSWLFGLDRVDDTRTSATSTIGFFVHPCGAQVALLLCEHC